MGSKPAPVQAVESVISTGNSWRPIVTPMSQSQASSTRRRKGFAAPSSPLDVPINSVLNDRLG